MITLFLMPKKERRLSTMVRIKEYANVPVALIYNMIGRFISAIEKNKCKFKEEDKLQKNALLLYLYLHFIADSNGSVKYKNVKEIANALRCSTKTVLRSLIKLQNNKSISKIEKIDYKGEKWKKGSLGMRKKITIKDYDKIHKSRMGYIQISFEQFKALLDSKNIYELRLNLRLLTDVSIPASQKKSKSFQELRDLVGTHVKKDELKNMLNNSAFVSFTEQSSDYDESVFTFAKGSITFGADLKKMHHEEATEIADEFESVLSSLHEEKENSFSSFFEKLSHAGNFFNLERTESFRLFMSKKIPAFNSLHNLEKDIAIMRNKYSMKEIKAAIRKFLNGIAIANDYNPKKSVAIYLRSILEENFKFA